MKIAYNSAHIQIETLNSTFAQQAIILYFYLYSNFQEIAMMNANLPYLNAMSDECTKRKQQQVKCSRRLAKLAQTMQKKHTPGNDAIACRLRMMSWHLLSKSSCCYFCC